MLGSFIGLGLVVIQGPNDAVVGCVKPTYTSANVVIDCSKTLQSVLDLQR